MCANAVSMHLQCIVDMYQLHLYIHVYCTYLCVFYKRERERGRRRERGGEREREGEKGREREREKERERGNIQYIYSLYTTHIDPNETVSYTLLVGLIGTS